MRVKILAQLMIATSTISLGSACTGQGFDRHDKKVNSNLEAFLKQYVEDPNYDYRSARYIATKVDLHNRGQNVIVYFTDQRSCGSAGCTTLILADEGGTFKVVTSLTAAWRPIRVLNSQSNGWRDIGVWVQGGGIQPGYEAVLTFDGQSYPRNPTVVKKRSVNGSKGEIVISREEKDISLFQ
jgi:hypothetical protein